MFYASCISSSLRRLLGSREVHWYSDERGSRSRLHRHQRMHADILFSDSSSARMHQCSNTTQSKYKSSGQEGQKVSLTPLITSILRYSCDEVGKRLAMAQPLQNHWGTKNRFKFSEARSMLTAFMLVAEKPRQEAPKNREIQNQKIFCS